MEGFGPHSPRDLSNGCGLGFVSHRKVRLADAQGGSCRANRFLMQDGRRFSLVLFWYHSRARVEAGGMEAWLWMAWDTFSSRHNDISLVPVIVPVSGLEEWLREG